MFKNIKNIISVVYSLSKFLFIKCICFRSFRFHFVERFSPSTMINIWPKGKMVLGKKVIAHTGTKLSVTDGAVLNIGDNVGLNYNCIVCCRKKIVIGKNTILGPGVIIYDHDHEYDGNKKVDSRNFKTGDVEIGENCWIGANTIILRGTKIGDNCVVGAGSVIKGNFPANSVVVQKRNTFVNGQMI